MLRNEIALQMEVDESGSRGLASCDTLGERQPRRDLGGGLSRVALQGFGQLEGDGARQIAELRAGRVLHRELGGVDAIEIAYASADGETDVVLDRSSHSGNPGFR